MFGVGKSHRRALKELGKWKKEKKKEKSWCGLSKRIRMRVFTF